MPATSPEPSTELDPNQKDPHQKGAKLDAGKPRVALCLLGYIDALRHLVGAADDVSDLIVLGLAAKRWPRALEDVAAVTTAGALKYTPGGWAEVDDGVNRYADAWGRHLLAVGRGELFDDGKGGTGCLHVSQMAWNLLSALTLAIRADEVPEHLFSLDYLTALTEDQLDLLEQMLARVSNDASTEG